MFLMLNRRMELCALVFLMTGLTCKTQSDLRTAIVHIVLVDTLGRDLGIAAVTSFQQKTTAAPELRSRFKDNTASNIPFGVYHLRTFRENFYSVDRTVLVHQREVRVVAQLDVGEENGPLPYTIAGIIKALPLSKGHLWVRA